MVNPITPNAWLAFIEGATPYACLDVREPEAYRWAHLPGASLMPDGRLPVEIELAVPCPGIPVLVYDEDGSRAVRAAATLHRMGYRRARVLAGGLKHWMALSYPIEWSLAPSGEPLGADGADADGDALTIGDLDGLPACASTVSDAEAAYGADRRRRHAFAWRWIRRQMARDTDRFALLAPTPERRAEFEAGAASLAQNEAIRSLDIPTLRTLLERSNREPMYLIDVRTAAEYRQGHIPGFQWFPRRPTRSYADEAVVMQNCPIIFCCDGQARASIAASWFGQIVCAEVYMVEGGAAAWAAWGLTLERGGQGPES